MTQFHSLNIDILNYFNIVSMTVLFTGISIFSVLTQFEWVLVTGFLTSRRSKLFTAIPELKVLVINKTHQDLYIQHGTSHGNDMLLDIAVFGFIFCQDQL